MIDKKLIYAGVGALVLLIIYNSTRKMELKEVTELSALAFACCTNLKLH